MSGYLEWKRRALMMSSNLFWLPSGMDRSDVLAAYQFKGASDETQALTDLTGHGYNLTKTGSVTWNTSTGFTFPQTYGSDSNYLDNSRLDNQNILCAVVRYMDLTLNNRGYLVTAGGSNGTAFLFAATTVYQFDHLEDYETVGGEVANFTSPGYCRTKYNTWSSVGTALYASNKKAVTAGVVGANFGVNDSLYVNGSKESVASTKSGNTYMDVGVAGNQGKTFGNSHSSKSDLNNAQHAGKKLLAAVLFNRALTAGEHLEVANMMLAI